MRSARAVVNMPSQVAPGQVVSVRTMLAHPMETGLRPDGQGRIVPREIVQQFSATFNGQSVLQAQLHPAIAANPFVAFEFVAPGSGVLELRWIGDGGFEHVERVPLQVSATAR